MARMIPPSYSPKTSGGEKELFNKLRDDPNTSGWIALHSLDIKKHQSKIEGEIDMVVIVPHLGVLCIEVKGCNFERKEGKWIYPYETSIEGPFKQASKAMYSLREYLVGKDSSLSGLLFFSAAVFTHRDFAEQSPEWHSWQYIDKTQFLRCPISVSITNILEHAHSHVKNRVGRYSWYDDIKSRPSVGQVKRIVSLIRDDFEYPVSLRDDQEQIQRSICRFTEEQFEALDLLQENERVIFKGPAGTGKTFLAIEVVRRTVLDGKSVLFLCYNSLLSDWLKAQTGSFTTDANALQCRTFHSLLLEITGERPIKTKGNEYWQKELPRRATDLLLDDERPWLLFDLIVLDEAQDLFEEEYLDVLELLLRGGLAGGKWAFFGDFERQAIYDAEGKLGAKQALVGLANRAPSLVNYPLRINCRNAEPIAEILAITSGLEPGYKKVLQDFEGAEVDPLFYSSAINQKRLLQTAVAELIGPFNAGEIMVLSMRSDEESCAGAASDGSLGIRLAPIRKVQDSQTIAFSSIHAFKGLEAPAVIITDIESLDDDRTKALLYVGMSRAKVRLFMLMHEKCRTSYDRILDAGFSRISRK